MVVRPSLATIYLLLSGSTACSVMKLKFGLYKTIICGGNKKWRSSLFSDAHKNLSKNISGK
jgi:hypothetical protein